MDRYAKAHLFQDVAFFKGEGGLNKDFLTCREREKGSFKQELFSRSCMSWICIAKRTLSSRKLI